jgi:hypothetical protein
LIPIAVDASTIVRKVTLGTIQTLSRSDLGEILPWSNLMSNLPDMWPKTLALDDPGAYSNVLEINYMATYLVDDA